MKKEQPSVICVFCQTECEPAPTKRGWASAGRYGEGLHFDCATKVADLEKYHNVPQQESSSNEAIESTKKMLRDKTKYMNNADKYSTKKQAYKAGWRDGFNYFKLTHQP